MDQKQKFSVSPVVLCAIQDPYNGLEERFQIPYLIKRMNLGSIFRIHIMDQKTTSSATPRPKFVFRIHIMDQKHLSMNELEALLKFRIHIMDQKTKSPFGLKSQVIFRIHIMDQKRQSLQRSRRQNPFRIHIMDQKWNPIIPIQAHRPDNLGSI